MPAIYEPPSSRSFSPILEKKPKLRWAKRADIRSSTQTVRHEMWLSEIGEA
jgi:hypothetical protein